MVKITTDSTADLGELFAEHNISKIPLFVNIGEDSYLDGINISPIEIFSIYEEKKILPKTAARSPEDFKEFFDSELKGTDGIVHISISSKLSLMHQSASEAARHYDNVYAVDSFSLSSGVGLLVLFAQEKAREGLSAREIYQECIEIAPYIQASFVVDSMEFLHKGGRCSGVQRLAATLLKIKPTLHLIDGKIEVGSKFSGKMEKNIAQYVDDTLRKHNTPDLTRIFITHTHASQNIIDIVINKIKEIADFKDIIVTTAGATITSHCGKGTIGILYINKPL